MTPEFLEYELRRLPGVVSVAVDGSAVSLLVNPNVDADALRVLVAAMLATAGVELEVRVLGGIGAAGPAHHRVAPIAVGATAGFGVLAAAVAVAALTGALSVGAPAVHPNQTAQRPPAAATPLTTVPNFGPSTTLVPGAPALGIASAPTGPSEQAAAAPATGDTSAAGSTRAGTTPADALQRTTPVLGATPGVEIPVIHPPSLPSPVGPVPITPPPVPPAPPTDDYVVDAPAVQPPSVWPARTDPANAAPPSAAVTVTPEATA